MANTDMMLDLCGLKLKCFIYVLSFLFFGVTICMCQIDSEFHFSKVAVTIPENTGRRIERFSYLTLPHLYENDSITINICLERSTIIDFKNITYSNDGASDTVALYQDGFQIGSFETHGNGDWGRLWDVSNTTGFLGRTGLLQPGVHNITFKVTRSGDCFGVELWSLKVSVFAAIDHGTFWCKSSYALASRKRECLSDHDRQTRLTSPATSTTAAPTTTTLPPTFVNVTQHSFATQCLDKRNVKVKFTTTDIAGTVILVRQEITRPNLALSSNSTKQDVNPRYCDSDIWQIGTVDGTNAEFKSIYPGKTIHINISEETNPDFIFPTKLLPFVTTDINIYFSVPSDIRMERGSAFLALGLVNVTKPVDVGLRYYDHSQQTFSDIHIIRFTQQYEVMGWNIPQLSNNANADGNTIHLHFSSEANVVMFDFLKLQYNKRDERKFSSVISRQGRWRVKGQRYSDSVGMRVVVDQMQEGLNMEDVLLLYQVSQFSRYETILRVHSNGLFFPYKTFPVSADVAERMMIDVSGFFLQLNGDQSSPVSPTAIRSLHIDTTIDAINVHYNDGSTLHLALTASAAETKIEVIKLLTPSTQQNNGNSQSVVFVSTHVTPYYAGVNSITSDGFEKGIMDSVDAFSGHYSFKFTKKSSNPLLYTNTDIHFIFPR